jgi:hypothetical protein
VRSEAQAPGSRLRSGRALRLFCGTLVTVVLTTSIESPPSARADGDPASDVLLLQSAFYPYPPVSQALETAMDTVLRAAARAGLQLKVAVVGSLQDLGAVPDFLGHPQRYAEFLDREISYNHQQSLLVVMPSGFGVVAAGPARALAGVKIDARHGSGGLVHSAILAVVTLVRATGTKIALPAIQPNSRPRARAPTILFVLPAALLLLAGLLILRRREPRR